MRYANGCVLITHPMKPCVAVLKRSINGFIGMLHQVVMHMNIFAGHTQNAGNKGDTALAGD